MGNIEAHTEEDCSTRLMPIGERVVLQMVAVGMQFIVLIADALLIYRCWVVFSGKKWVCAIPMVPYSISIVLSIYGTVLFARGYESLSDADSLVFYAGGFMPAIASFLVNFIVTTSICLHILQTRRRLNALLDDSRPPPSDTLYAVAIIVESALPASCIAIYVPIATLFTRTGIYVSRVAWVACTALAPQMIAIRVMQRRDIHSLRRLHKQATTIGFAEVTEGDGGRTG